MLVVAFVLNIPSLFPLSRPISLFASIAMDAALPNFGIQEMSWAIHYNKSADLGTYLKNPEVLEVKDGFIKVPMSPGLGIEINEEMVRANAKDAKHWSNLVWRGEDGGLREVSDLLPRYARSRRLIDRLLLLGGSSGERVVQTIRTLG